MSRSVHRCRLAPTPASAGQARRFVDSVLTDAGVERLAYTATVLVSELVANAVLHTGTHVELVVEVDGDRARVEVHDGSAQLPARKHYSPLSGTGRGLLMVERAAAVWGAETTPAGKVVWFELGGSAAPVFDVLEADAP